MRCAAAALRGPLEHGLALMFQCKAGPPGQAALDGFADAQRRVVGSLADVLTPDAIVAAPPRTLCALLAVTGYFVTGEHVVPKAVERLVEVVPAARLSRGDLRLLLLGVDAWGLPHCDDHRLSEASLRALTASLGLVDPLGRSTPDASAASRWKLLGEVLQAYAELDAVPSEIDAELATAIRAPVTHTREACASIADLWQLASLLHRTDPAAVPMAVADVAVRKWPTSSVAVVVAISELPRRENVNERSDVTKLQAWALVALTAMQQAGAAGCCIASQTQLMSSIMLRAPKLDLKDSVKLAQALLAPLTYDDRTGISRQAQRVCGVVLERGGAVCTRLAGAEHRATPTLDDVRGAARWVRAAVAYLDTAVPAGERELLRFRNSFAAAAHIVATREEYAGPLVADLESVPSDASQLALGCFCR